MSETALTDPSESPSMLLDGEAPRLATGPISAPAPTGTPTLDAPTFDLPPDAPSLPVVSPVLSAPEAPGLPGPGAHAAPADLPAPGAEETAEESADGAAATSDHPMAHLMPPKTAANEASRRAAEKRAAKKAKAKKVKIGVIAGMLTFTALVGPPLFKWLSNAINEAGTSQTQEPAE